MPKTKKRVKDSKAKNLSQTIVKKIKAYRPERGCFTEKINPRTIAKR